MHHLLIICLIFSLAAAADSLFYTEIQGILGYAAMDDKVVYRSGHAADAMQLNSLGFDYLQKFSGQAGDTGTAALQARLAYSADREKAELQLYNAYFKNQASGLWIGHNRIAFGLASYWDTHGDLLQPLPMYGFGFDRDWGLGLSKDTLDGGLQFSLTSGTGLNLRTEGNWLTAIRLARGVLNYDNYSVGLALLSGQVPDSRGYTILDRRLKTLSLIGV
ncbi:MAG: hypothetical protein LBQ83_08280, partial [Candidatus Margulisbacteria bacterium]|nr:hypothetical protein [Candidatus Margulisiibacteriota bacterium]